MVKMIPMLLSFFALQANCKAAPSETNLALSEFTKESPKLDSVPNEVIDLISVENESEINQRQKRFYDYPEYGYQPFGFPPNVPYRGQFHNSKRDESQNTGVNGVEDSLMLIFNRLQGILSDVRQQAQPQPHRGSIPVFIPVLYIPQAGCGCTTTSQVTSRPVNGNTQTQPNQETTTAPALPNRLGGIDTDNEPNVDVVAGDGNRPVSFDPIIPQTPIDIPVPPVEHGSVQAGAETQPQISTTTFRPSAARPSKGDNRTPYNKPTICDKAVVSCCLRPQITHSCFVQQGCPDPSIYGNPCDAEVVLNLVKKVAHYLEQMNG